MSVDPINSEALLELLTTTDEVTAHPENTSQALTEYFHDKGFYKVTYLLTESAMLEKRMDLSTMNQEGVLRRVRLTRTGQRVDLLIYSSFSD